MVQLRALGSDAILCMTQGESSTNTIAAATSALSISFIDPTTLQDVRAALTGTHADRINELGFMGPDVLYSASSDGTVKLWDAKQAANKPQAEFRDATATHGTSGGTSGEIWTAASEGGSNLLAAGTESAVAVWDVRKANAAPVARYEVHTEAVTQVRFKPAGGSGILLSGSVDALLCEIDTRIADEDEAVLNVINTEGPVSSLGFYGTDLSRAWVLSSTDVVSTWDLAAGDCLGVRDNLVAHKADDFLLGEARSRERGADGRLPIDFVVGVHWDAASSRLVLVGGDQGGAVHVFEIGAATAPPTPLQSLKAGSGHVDAVRCFRFGAGLASITTGGEDGRLCSWVPAAAAAPKIGAALGTASQTSSSSSSAAAASSAPAGGKAKKSHKEEARSKAKPYDRPASSKTKVGAPRDDE